MELPRLQPLYEKYKDQGFEIIAVDGKRDTERATAFIEENGLTYTMLENAEGDDEVVGNLYKVRAYPSSFLIDRDGKVMYFHLGFDAGD
ncbi:MAG: TlpA family protein disulfide reductase, partial [Thermoanaerobaculales bacterium]|nr:TlpA family protein disulfide reductase [Thermoanaerobaculales bacterium]